MRPKPICGPQPAAQEERRWRRRFHFKTKTISISPGPLCHYPGLRIIALPCPSPPRNRKHASRSRANELQVTSGPQPLPGKSPGLLPQPVQAQASAICLVRRVLPEPSSAKTHARLRGRKDIWGWHRFAASIAPRSLARQLLPVSQRPTLADPLASWPAQDLRVKDTQVTATEPETETETETEHKATPVLFAGE